MMKDPETFIDLTLVRCFNKLHLHPHLHWLQKIDDLTGALGHQSHQIAVWFHLMKFDLCHIMGEQTLMKDCFEAVRKCGSSNAADSERHLNKLSVFLKEANDSLGKHFKRWVGDDLLPAALLSEQPLAQVVGAAMLGRPFPDFPSADSVTNGLRVTGRIDFVFCCTQETHLLEAF